MDRDMHGLTLKGNGDDTVLSQERIQRAGGQGRADIYFKAKVCTEYVLSKWKTVVSILGFILYFSISSYLMLRVSQVFLLPRHFVHRVHERALLFLGLNAFCFLPLVLPKLRGRILKVNLSAATFTYAFVFLIGTTDMGRLLSKPLLASDKLSDADVIVVLNSGYADLKFAYGAQLYKLGYADRIMVFVPEQYASYLARKEKVPPEAVLSVPTGKNTYEHAVLAASVFRQKGWHTGILVTLPPHMLRASKTFVKQGFSMIRAPIPDSLWYGRPGRFLEDGNAPGKALDDYGFWDRCKIRHIWLMQVLHEYMGILKYYCKSYI